LGGQHTEKFEPLVSTEVKSCLLQFVLFPFKRWLACTLCMRKKTVCSGIQNNIWSEITLFP